MFLNILQFKLMYQIIKNFYLFLRFMFLELISGVNNIFKDLEIYNYFPT